MASRAPRQPSNEDAGDGEPSGDEGVLEVALMPRTRASNEDGPFLARGEMPQAFAEDEGIAAEDDGDVVMPAAEGRAFVVIQSKLALEILIHALGAPAFLGDPDELLAARRFAHPRERVVRRGLLALGPLDQEPVLTAVDVASVHLDHGESRQQSAAASLPPRGWTERTAWEPASERFDGHRRGRGARGFGHARDDRRGIHAHGVVEVEPSKSGAK